MPLVKSYLDHLVVIAPDLASGAAWCEALLGIRPAAGGAHPLMGTHNRLVRLEGAAFSDAYLEIIAIDPAASPERKPPLARWFDLDDPALLARIARHGPQLAHWVVRTDNVAAATASWARLGIDRGRALTASRMSAAGLLTWKITVRDDGARLLEGCLPTLIEWGPLHPAPALAAQGVVLEALALSHPEVGLLEQAFSAIGLTGIAVRPGPAGISASLASPAGRRLLLGGDTP